MRLSPGGYLLASSGPLPDQLHDEPGASNHLAGERPTKPPEGSVTWSLLGIVGSNVLLGRLRILLGIHLLIRLLLAGSHVLARLFSNRPSRLAGAVPGSGLL